MLDQFTQTGDPLQRHPVQLEEFEAGKKKQVYLFVGKSSKLARAATPDTPPGA
jgi:hypothetical protein